jgi:AMMECR1 domain-containing protein
VPADATEIVIPTRYSQFVRLSWTEIAEGSAGHVQSGKEGQHTYIDVSQMARQNDRRFSDLTSV